MIYARETSMRHSCPETGYTHTMLVDSKMVLYSGRVCGSISTAAIFQTNMWASGGGKHQQNTSSPRKGSTRVDSSSALNPKYSTSRRVKDPLLHASYCMRHYARYTIWGNQGFKQAEMWSSTLLFPHISHKHTLMSYACNSLPVLHKI